MKIIKVILRLFGNSQTRSSSIYLFGWADVNRNKVLEETSESVNVTGGGIKTPNDQSVLLGTQWHFPRASMERSWIMSKDVQWAKSFSNSSQYNTHLFSVQKSTAPPHANYQPPSTTLPGWSPTVANRRCPPFAFCHQELYADDIELLRGIY